MYGIYSNSKGAVTIYQYRCALWLQCFQKSIDYGRIHLPHLWICKYFTDDSSINFHDKVFLRFLKKFGKKWRKNLSWKFTEEWLHDYLKGWNQSFFEIISAICRPLWGCSVQKSFPKNIDFSLIEANSATFLFTF